MEMRQLAYFIAVAEELNFTRAARRALVAQPAISQQMLALERELGEALFDRGPRSVRLTPAGQAFLPHARATLAAAQAGRDAITSLRGLLTGRLSVGTIQHGPANLATLIGDFHREHPGVELRVAEGHTGPLLTAVRAGEMDFAYAGLGPGERIPAGLSSEVVAAEPVVLAVHPTHRLAGQESVPLSRLRDQPMVTLPEGAASGRWSNRRPGLPGSPRGSSPNRASFACLPNSQRTGWAPPWSHSPRPGSHPGWRSSASAGRR